MRKSVYGFSVKVQNKLGCTTTEDDKMLFQLEISDLLVNEPRCEKTGLRGFRPGPKQTRLHSDRRWLEAWNFVFW